MTPVKSGHETTPLCAVYARVSTDDQNCDLQLRECKAFIGNRGWRLYAEYVDAGYSGSRASRPQLNKLLQDARARKFDTVVVWKIDRFGRSVANFVDHMRELSNWGVRFLTVTQMVDTDDSNPGARLLLHIMVAFAEFERAMIAERVTAGLRAAKHRGVRIGRPKAVLDRQKIIDLHVAGKSNRTIARDLGINRGMVYRAIRDLPGDPRTQKLKSPK